MLAVNHLIGFGAGDYTQNLYQIISGLSLTSNLQVCLDAGEGDSFTSGQKWLDLSGNGYDFFLGTTSGSDATDPTFNGTADALTSAEYFSSDGGDLFTYDTTNETWMQNLHKDSAAFSAILMYYRGTAGVASCGFGTRGSSSNTGARFQMNSSNQLTFGVNNAGSTVLNVSSTGTVSASAWHLIGIILDEASGGTASKFYIDGSSEDFNGTYSSPSAGSATYTMQIGAAGNSVAPIDNGGRLAAVAIWSSVLTTANFNSIFGVIRTRFGI